MSRRPHRSRRSIGTSFGAGAYVAPTVPVLAKAGAFWWADDLSLSDTDPVALWTPRHDVISAGNWDGSETPPTYESGGWVTPEGNQPSVRFTSASSQFLRNTGLATLQDGEDEPVEFILWMQSVTQTVAGVMFWSSTSSTSPRKGLLILNTGLMRWYAAAGFANLSGTGEHNLLQQCLRIKNSGTSVQAFRNEHVTFSSAASDVAAQSVNTVLMGGQDNGGTPTNFFNGRIRGLWVRNPASAALTDAEALELVNWGYGAYATAPYYSGATAFEELAWYGQSNAQGLGTGAVAGLPDSGVRMWQRSADNGVLDPTALADLDRRDDTGTPRHGAWAYAQAAEAPVPHHHVIYGDGATFIGDATTASVWADEGIAREGLYAEQKASEMYRAARNFRARMGGTPSPHVIFILGESDAQAGTTEAAYEAGLATMLTRFRALHGANCPVHLVGLSESMTGGGIVLAELQAVNQAMQDVATGDANCYYVSMADVTDLQGDNLHYDATGYSTMWDRIQTSIAGES